MDIYNLYTICDILTYTKLHLCYQGKRLKYLFRDSSICNSPFYYYFSIMSNCHRKTSYLMFFKNENFKFLFDFDFIKVEFIKKKNKIGKV